MKNGAVLAAILGLVVVGCGERKPSQPKAEQAAAPTPPPAAIPSNIQRSGPELAAAFKAAFGVASPATVRPDPIDDNDPSTIRTFTPAALITSQSGTYLISQGQGIENVSDCHACAGGLMVYKMDGPRGQPQRWFIDLSLGGFGGPADWAIRTDLLYGPALMVSSGGTWQGCSGRWDTVYELTPNGLVERVPGIQTSVETPIGEQSDGTITAEARGQSFLVRYTGDGALTARYTRKGETFTTDANIASLPTC